MKSIYKQGEFYRNICGKLATQVLIKNTDTTRIWIFILFVLYHIVFLRLDIVIITGRTEYTAEEPRLTSSKPKKKTKTKVFKCTHVDESGTSWRWRWWESNWKEGKLAQFALNSPEVLMRSYQSRNREKGDERGTAQTRMPERRGAETNMPTFPAGITNPAGRTAFCRWTVRSVSDTLVWETISVRWCPQTGCDGDSIVLCGGPAIMLKQGHKLHGGSASLGNRK